MKNFKRFASAILPLTLALSLTPCGGSKETASDTPAAFASSFSVILNSSSSFPDEIFLTLF